MASSDAVQGDRRGIRVLVVDDSPMDRTLVAKLLEKQLSATVRVAENGKDALQLIAAEQPDIVLTDMQMPQMDGLALVEAVRRDFPFVPTILMTAHGSEEIALAALRSGAASYVNKRNLAQRVAETIKDVLAVLQGHREQLRLHECWETTEFEFHLENDASLIPVFLNHLQQYQSSVRPRDETELVRVGVVLHEALRNAILHGNLELSSNMRNQDPESYYRLAEKRRRQEPYKSRLVYIRVRESRHESRYVIKDEGSGFDTKSFTYDPTDATNLDKPSGRGLFLIRTFMDEVRFNDRGNEITMIHRRNGARGRVPPLARLRNSYE